MPLEPALRELSRTIGETLPGLPSSAMNATEARRRAGIRARLAELIAGGEPSTDGQQTVNWRGYEFAVRIISRTAGPPDSLATEGDGVGPLVLFLHSGGWVAGSTDACRRACQVIATGLEATVVALDYPLAPERPYPAALDTTCAALDWLASGESGLAGDPGQVVVAGESAGGNLAAAALLRNRDAGNPVPIRAALLVVPVLDGDFGRPSYERFDRGDIDGRSGMHWYSQQYLAGRDEELSATAYVWPLRSASLGGLPPVILVQAQYDPLVDEQEEFVFRLGVDGGDVTALRYPGVGHSFFGLDHLSPSAARAQAEACAAVAGALGRGQRGPA
ncbi:MAG: alpha/beta hydrolase [Frankia sp.]